MKKEILALILLGLLTVTAMLNGRYMKSITDETALLLQQTLESAKQGDMETAADSAKSAASTWKKYDTYTHMMLPHSDIKAVTEALITVNCAVTQSNIDELETDVQTAIFRLRAAAETDSLRLGTVM